MQHLDVGLVHELLDGEIPSERLAPIQEHLARCESCRQMIESEREMVVESDELIEVLDEVTAPVQPQASVIASLPPKRSRAVTRWTGRLAWAASLVLAVGLGYSAGGGFGSPLVEAARQTASTGRAAGEATADEIPGVDAASGVERDASASDEPNRVGEVGAVANVGVRAGEQRRVDGRREVAALEEIPTETTAPPAAPAASVPSDDLSDRAFADAEADAAEPARLTAQTAESEGNRAFQARESVVRDENVAAKAIDSMRERQTVGQEEVVGIPSGPLWRVSGMELTSTELVGAEVRSLYRHPLGYVTLVQRRVGTGVAWRLLVPVGFPADSLTALKSRVR